MAESGKSTKVATAPKGSMLERLLGVATTPAERERAFALAEQYQKQQLILELVAEVKANSWGNRVSPVLRAGIVRWALDIGADPVYEVDILGGGPYLNAKYWMRLVAAEPDFLKIDEVWVHTDPRASEEENAKRADLRVQYAIPDELDGNLGLKQSERKKDPKPVPIKAAVLVFGHFTGRGPFIGKKWSPSRANDDVGLDFPEPTALTRAYRKMALQAVRAQPVITGKLKTLIAAELGGAVAPLLDARDGQAMDKPATPESLPPAEPEQPKTVKHNPNAICAAEDWHPRSECKLEKQEAPSAASDA